MSRSDFFTFAAAALVTLGMLITTACIAMGAFR